MKPSIRKSLVATAVLSALSAESAMAQLEEVIVTAERREANLQETPISIQVLNSEEIQSRGIRSAMDLVDQVAGVQGYACLLYTSPSPRDLSTSRMPSSA